MRLSDRSTRLPLLQNQLEKRKRQGEQEEANKIKRNKQMGILFV
jgi:hypothetical protein